MPRRAGRAVLLTMFVAGCCKWAEWPAGPKTSPAIAFLRTPPQAPPWLRPLSAAPPRCCWRPAGGASPRCRPSSCCWRAWTSWTATRGDAAQGWVLLPACLLACPPACLLQRPVVLTFQALIGCHIPAPLLAGLQGRLRVDTALKRCLELLGGSVATEQAESWQLPPPQPPSPPQPAPAEPQPQTQPPLPPSLSLAGPPPAQPPQPQPPAPAAAKKRPSPPPLLRRPPSPKKAKKPPPPPPKKKPKKKPPPPPPKKSQRLQPQQGEPAQLARAHANWPACQAAAWTHHASIHLIIYACLSSITGRVPACLPASAEGYEPCREGSSRDCRRMCRKVYKGRSWVQVCSFQRPAP